MDKTAQLSVRRQCELLKICRSMIYYLPKGEPKENLALMREIDELHMEDASAGSRRMRSYLNKAIVASFSGLSRARFRAAGIVSRTAHRTCR